VREGVLGGVVTAVVDVMVWLGPKRSRRNSRSKASWVAVPLMDD
jgi:hypothetical protein